MCHYKDITYKCQGTKREVVPCKLGTKQDPCLTIDSEEVHNVMKFYCCKPSCCEADLVRKREIYLEPLQYPQQNPWIAGSLWRQAKERLNHEKEAHMRCYEMASRDPNCPFDHLPLQPKKPAGFSFAGRSAPSFGPGSAAEAWVGAMDNVE